MRSTASRLASTLIAFSLVSACQQSGGLLPTYDPGHFCGQAALAPVTVRIDEDASPPVWADSAEGAGTFFLEWPDGFSIGTDGTTIIDPDGRTVARDGGIVEDMGGGSSARGPAWFAVCSIGGTSYVR